MKQFLGLLAAIVVLVVAATFFMDLPWGKSLREFNFDDLKKKFQEAAEKSKKDAEWVPYRGTNSVFFCESNIGAYDLNDPSKQVGAFKKGTKLEVRKVFPSKGLAHVRFMAADGKSIEAVCKASEMGIVLWRTDEYSLPENEVDETSKMYAEYIEIEHILDWIAPRYPVLTPEVDRLRDKLHKGCQPILDEYNRLMALQSPDVIARFNAAKKQSYFGVRELLSERRPPDRGQIQSAVFPLLEREIDRMIAQSRQLKQIRKKG